MAIANRRPTATPKVSKAILADLDASVTEAIRAEFNAHPDRGLTGADLTRCLIATGHLPNKGKGTKNAVAAQGLRLRTYARSHGAWVGQGRTYGMTVAEARRIAAGFIAKVPPPEGVRYAKGQVVKATKDGASVEEVASAA